MTATNLQNLRALWHRGRQSAMLVGVIGTGIRAGANLLLLPILLVKLSEADLALWWGFMALGGFAFLADFGFGPSISRVYSYLWAGAADFETEGMPEPTEGRPPNFDRLAELNSTVRYLYRRLSLIAVSALALGGTLFLRKSVMASSHPTEMWILWAGYAIAIGYNLMTSHWMAACQGINRMRDLQMAFVASSLAYVIVASCLLLDGAGMAGVVAATFVRACVTHLYCRRVYFQAVPANRERERVDLKMVKTLWPNACKFGILSIGSCCIGNTLVLVSTRVLTREITASVGLTVQIGTFATTCAALWLGVKWPQITILRTQGRLQEMASVFARRLSLVMVSYCAMAVVLLLWGNVPLALKGTHTRLLPGPYLMLYLFYLAQNIFYVQFGSLAYTENVVPFFKISVFTGIAELIVTYILACSFGLWGLLAGPCLAELACSSWFTVRRGFQGQPLSVRGFCRAALLGREPAK
jgi:hypothetical protein